MQVNWSYLEYETFKTATIHKELDVIEKYNRYLPIAAKEINSILPATLADEYISWLNDITSKICFNIKGMSIKELKVSLDKAARYILTAKEKIIDNII